MRHALLVGLTVLLAAASGHAAPAPADSTPVRTGPKLLVGTKVVKPFAFKDDDGTWTGISVELWSEIARRRGWTFEWREAPDTNTLVDMVARGDVDIGIAAITMKPSRAELVDFSNSMYESGLGIAARVRPPGLLSTLGQLASGSLLRMVAMLTGILVLVGSGIWLLEHRHNPEQFEADPRRGVWSGIWWSAVTMTTVGYGDKAPRTTAGRILGLLWMYAGVVMISGFTAVVASTLTTRHLVSTVRGADDLARVRVGAKTGESPFEILENRGIRPVAFESIQAGLRAVAADQIDAFVHDQPVLWYELRESPDLGDKIQVLPEPIREEEYGIAVKQVPPPYRNQLREDINATLLDIKTAGVMREIEARWLGSR